MLPHREIDQSDPETPELTQLRLKRWFQHTTTLPRTGIVAVVGPSGYDKTRFTQMLMTEQWVKNFSTSYVSVSTLARTPMALMQAIVRALQLPATQQLPAALERARGLDSVTPSIISAAREQFQDPSLDQHLLILDDLDSMTDEMTSALTNILVRTMGKVTLRIVLSGRSMKLGLRNAGVPVTMITTDHLALTKAELRAMGLPYPELQGWPLAVRLALTAMSEANPGNPLEPIHTLIERLLDRVDAGLVRSLEAASICPDWPLSLPVMRALGVDPEFVTKALDAGLTIIEQPDGSYKPHMLLQQGLQGRLATDPVRLNALSVAYASSTDVDTRRQLETLLTLPPALAQARLGGIVRDVPADDMGDWVSAHTSVLWKLYSAKLLVGETDVAVHLACARGEAGQMQDAYNLLRDPSVRPAGVVVIEEAKARLLSLQGRNVRALECHKRAIKELELLPVSADHAPIYARAALRETLMVASGYAEASLSSAEQHARTALRHATPDMHLVRNIAYSALARIQALRGNGASMDGTSVAALTSARLMTPDALGTARLIADGLLECGDTYGAAPLLTLIERDSPDLSAMRRVDLPLLYARRALLEGNPALAVQFAGAAWSVLAEDHRSDQALVLHAGELRMLAELLSRQAMNKQERKIRTLETLKMDVYEPYQLVILKETGARGSTLDAFKAWMGIQDGEIKGHYGALERLLPELLEARSVMYVPALLLLLIRKKLELPVVVRQLQAARNLIGRGVVQAVISMMVPEIEVPESPRLDVRLFGVPSATLAGRVLDLPPRAMLLLAIMVTRGTVSGAQLESEYTSDFPTDNIRWKASAALQDALADSPDGADIMSKRPGGRKLYGLQNYDVHSDYTDLPHMTLGRRHVLMLSPFLDTIDSEFSIRMRAAISR
jgi:hypothetical protein